ncbi:DNA primase family protein [Azospirillum thermophilum]|uniref:SF3 helicase domain-containing protein n=1 Tax=Azospirillum thermophilum TaxID=2202148 RepID=A0A2S2CKW5_9PROT|nr:phage/plasmid primase, P4 family [Azospirillum thermophilum]AWK85158.1 hypothetical protein DEW08_02255 [Azospirillum thermophilum]
MSTQLSTSPALVPSRDTQGAIVPYDPFAVAPNPEFALPSVLEHGSDVEMSYLTRDMLIYQYGSVVFTEGEFWSFSATHWVPLPDEILRQYAHKFDGKFYLKPGGKRDKVLLNKGRIDSILHEVAMLMTVRNFFSDAPIGINCLTGFVEIGPNGGTIYEHSPRHKQRHLIEAHYDAEKPALPGPLLTKLLNGCFANLEPDESAARILMLSQIGGAAIAGMATKLKKPKAAVLHGQTAENGKSQFLECFRAFLPADAVCAFSIQQIGDERYIPRLSGKLLNTCDELSAAAVTSDTFKRVVTGEALSGREVRRLAVEVRPVAQHVFSTNVLPSFIGGADRGVRRRLLIVPFERSIPDSEKVENIGARIADEEADGLLAWLIAGAVSLVQAGFFHESQACKQALDDWLFNSDVVLAWLNEECEVTGKAEDAVPSSLAYSAFSVWAKGEGYDRIPNANIFKQRMLAADPQSRIAWKPTNKGKVITGLRMEKTGFAT